MSENFLIIYITFTRINTMKKKDGLNTKDKKLLYYKNLRLSDDHQYESEEERKEEKEEKGQQTSKKLNEKEPLKKSTKYDWIKFNEWVNEKGKRHKQ